MADQLNIFSPVIPSVLHATPPAPEDGTLALAEGLALPHTLDACTVHGAFQLLTAYRRARRWQVEAEAGLAHWGSQLRALMGDRDRLDIMGWQVTRLPSGQLHVSYDVHEKEGKPDA